MKAALLIFSLAGTMANAATLKCWDTYLKSRRQPILEARIVANDQLSEVKVDNAEVDDTNKLVKGELITTGRSPYKNNQRFVLKNTELVLPLSLANPKLIEAQAAGRNGFTKGENGVVIGSYRAGSDGGSHFSIRLRCRSYAR